MDELITGVAMLMLALKELLCAGWDNKPLRRFFVTHEVNNSRHTRKIRMQTSLSSALCDYAKYDSSADHLLLCFLFLFTMGVSFLLSEAQFLLYLEPAQWSSIKSNLVQQKHCVRVSDVIDHWTCAERWNFKISFCDATLFSKWPFIVKHVIAKRFFVKTVRREKI